MQPATTQSSYQQKKQLTKRKTKLWKELSASNPNQKKPQQLVAPHKVTETRIYLLHQQIIEQLRENPANTLKIAHKNITRWKKRNGDWQAYLDWEEILKQPVDQIIQLLESNTDQAALARSNSPFAGIIPPPLRWSIIQSVQPQSQT